MPDTPTFFEKYLAKHWQQLLLLLIVGLVLRGATFGNPNLHLDDSFYFLVGLEMHHGKLPYVDIWDRKPLGLFLIYYLITGISKSIVAYEIAAWLFASATAMMINLIARTWTRTQGGILAGVTYLLMLPLFQGWGGQSPVFYNLFIVSAYLLVLRDSANLRSGRGTWRTFAAMGLCGLALTVKQTTIFEAVFLGLYASFLLKPGKLASVIAIFGWIALGILPTALIALTYFERGHWSEYWQAMVTANLTKGALPLPAILLNLLRMILRLYPLLAMAAAGLVVCDKNARPFVVGWVAAAMLGMAIIPNFYTHYALSLLVPLSVAASFILQRRDIGTFAAAMAGCFSLVIYNPFDFAESSRSAQSLERMAAAIRAHDSGNGLFVADGPVGLYALAGKEPLSPLAFPPHLLDWIERDTSPLRTADALDRILQRKPGVVAIAAIPSTNLSDGRTRRETMAYVTRNCRLVDTQISYEVVQTAVIRIYGDCLR